MNCPLPTRFAPSERSLLEDLRRQTEYFSDASITRHLLDAIPSLLLILNENRQIVYGNRTLLDLIGARSEAFVHGFRPGEVLHCVNAGREPGGCGTSDGCSACGMVAAVLTSLAGKKDVRECRFLRCREGKTEALDLLVWATPLEYAGERFSVFALSDISHEKRRRALEKIFFHDVLNVVGSIKGFAELLREYDPADRRDIYEMIHSAAEQSIDEIEAQRTLSAAETGELKVRPAPLELASFLGQIVDTYRHHAVGKGRTLEWDGAVPEILIVTDRVLLGRILGNMIKNALEACRSGDSVKVGCRSRGGSVEISVRNPGVIPPEVRHEIFQRSFTTKGRGRGLGTYSMKLLSEYLHGEVSFVTDEKEGTTFRIRLPRSPH